MAYLERSRGKILREHGVDETTTPQIRTDDRADFNSNRRFYHWTSDFGEYLEGMADKEQNTELKTVADLLDEIEDENSVLGIAYSGQAYPANYPAEDAGLFHKGNCPACRIDNRGYLCKARPSAEKSNATCVIFQHITHVADTANISINLDCPAVTGRVLLSLQLL